MGPYANVDPSTLTLEQLNERMAWLVAVTRNPSASNADRSAAKAGEVQMRQMIATYEQRKAEQDAKMQAQQRDALVKDLQGIAKGGGQAYGTTMRSVNKGNSRIGALAASGRGGANAAINAANAKALSTSQGHMQGNAARESEKSAARNALGQVIAQGQDVNVSAAQQQLADLRAQYGQDPGVNPYMTAAQTAAGFGQAAYSAWGQKKEK